MRLITTASALLTSALVMVPVASGAETPPKPVKLMTTETGDARLERQFFGQVAAKQTVDLAFQVGDEETPQLHLGVVPKQKRCL